MDDSSLNVFIFVQRSIGMNHIGLTVMDIQLHCGQPGPFHMSLSSASHDTKWWLIFPTAKLK